MHTADLGQPTCRGKTGAGLKWQDVDCVRVSQNVE